MKIFTAALLLVNLVMSTTVEAATNEFGRLLKAEDVEIFDISETPSEAPLSLPTYLAPLAPTSLVDKLEDTERQDGAMSMPPTVVPVPVPTVSPGPITTPPVTLPPVTVTPKPSPDFSFLTPKPVTPPPVPITASPVEVAQKVTAAPVVTSPPVMPPTTKKPKATSNPAQEEKEDNKKPTKKPTRKPRRRPTRKPNRNTDDDTNNDDDNNNDTDSDNVSETTTGSPTDAPVPAPEPTTWAPYMFATETIPVPTSAPGTVKSSTGSSNTASPTAYDGKVQTDGLKVTLFGIRALPATTEYEELTSAYFTKVYNDNSVENTFMVDVKITDETSVGETRKKTRRLGSTSTSSNEEEERELQTVAVEVTYTQTMWYNSDDPSFDPQANFPTVPLSKTSYRLEYVDTLKSKSIQGYDELYDVSSITRGDSDLLESGDSSTKKGLGLGAIIGIVIGSALLLFLLVAGSLNSNNQKKNKVSMVEDNNSGKKAMNDQPLTTKEMEMMHSDQEQPKSFFEKKTVARVDYDYGSATLGSQTRQASVIDTSFDEMVSSTGASGLASAEPTTTTTAVVLPIIEGSETTTYQHEEIIDVYAPAGKLGMVVDTPGEGPPVIHAVKDSSPLAGKMLVGDRLVALDDVDVSTMTAVRVSKLLSRKSNNEFRKLTVVRMVTKD